VIRRALAAAVVATLLATPLGDARAGHYYLALGDSLAVGTQPDSSGHGHHTSSGYVDVVARRLRHSHSDLQTVKLGCSGETARTMLAGGHCSYSRGSQLAQAVHLLHAYGSRAVAVTVDIGDNDVEPCLAHERYDAGCVKRRMAALKPRLARIARRLRAAGGSKVQIAGLADYDQFLESWRHGSSGRKFARRSVSFITDLNGAMDSAYQAHGIAAADATGAFATTDFTHRDRLKGYGRVPRNVARICKWTWACSGPPIGANDHANTTGYRVLGRIVFAALRKG
jgi:lysophospholipase L1-like esterase